LKGSLSSKLHSAKGKAKHAGLRVETCPW